MTPCSFHKSREVSAALGAAGNFEDRHRRARKAEICKIMEEYPDRNALVVRQKDKQVKARGLPRG